MLFSAHDARITRAIGVGNVRNPIFSVLVARIMRAYCVPNWQKRATWAALVRVLCAWCAGGAQMLHFPCYVYSQSGTSSPPKPSVYTLSFVFCCLFQANLRSGGPRPGAAKKKTILRKDCGSFAEGPRSTKGFWWPLAHRNHSLDKQMLCILL